MPGKARGNGEGVVRAGAGVAGDRLGSTSRGQRTRVLLALGAVAGPLYVVVVAAQILLREGFDVRLHAVSLLANGPGGWMQVGNFLVAGLLVTAGAAGLRRCMGGGRGATWGPLLLCGYGIGLVGSGVFPADPGAGFPPGAIEASGGMSQSGLLHFAFGGVAFYSLIGACLVWAARFRAMGRRLWSVWSAITGIYFFGAFAMIASGSISPGSMLGLYLAVLLGWVWHCGVSLDALRGAARKRSESGDGNRSGAREFQDPPGVRTP